MSGDEYQRELVKQLIVEREGETLHIKGAEFFPREMDYADEERLKILATKAVHTANGLADIVSNNCNIQKPKVTPDGHLEMHLSLAALACEIYMKSIIYNEKLNERKIVKGHYLDKLFVKLPSAVQIPLKEKYPDIERILSNVRDVFEKLRYDFEQFHIHGDYLVLFQLMDEFRTISNSYPKRETGSISFANGTLYLQ